MLKSTLLEAVQSAADEVRRFIDLDFKISNKEGVNNLVTEVDHASEKIIMDTIKKNFPDHYILTEESGEIYQDS
jgi:myo-inositol-1(or 4)-monophosphatase